MYTSIIKPLLKPVLKELAVEHAKDLVTKGARLAAERSRAGSGASFFLTQEHILLGK